MQEKMDRSRQHAIVMARVESLQRTAGIWEATVRKEGVERSEDSRQARPTFEDALEHRHAVLQKRPADQQLYDCLQSQAKPLTKEGLSLCGGQPSGTRPPTTGSARVNVNYCATPQRAPSPAAHGPMINHQLGAELQPVAQHCRAASVQAPTVAPPTGSQSSMPPRAIPRSASSTSRGPQSASNTGRMSSSTVTSTRGAALVHNASLPLLHSPAVFCSSPGRCGPLQAAPCAGGMPSAQAAAQVSRKVSLTASPDMRGRSLSVTPPDRPMSPSQAYLFRLGATEDPPGFVGGSCSVPLPGGSCSVPRDSQASVRCRVEEVAMLRHGVF